MKDIIQLHDSDIRETREEILKEQGGMCLICKQAAKRPVLDHDHKKKNKGSGLVRGVLCSNCNVFLAKIENNAGRYGITRDKLPALLVSVSIYLINAHYPYIHPTEKPNVVERRLMIRSYNNLCKYAKVMPPYNKGKFSHKLKTLFKMYNIEPEFYKEK